MMPFMQRRMVEVGLGVVFVSFLGCGRTSSSVKDATSADVVGTGGDATLAASGGASGRDSGNEGGAGGIDATGSLGGSDAGALLSDTGLGGTDAAMGARPTGETYGGGCMPTPIAGPCNSATAPNECTYGDSTRPACRVVSFCSGGVWQVQPSTCASPSVPAACPTTAPANYSSCSATTFCRFADGTDCECSERVSTPGSFVWSCSFPTTFPGLTGCLATPPNAGSICDPAVSISACTYRCNVGDATTISAVCGTDGLWQWRTVNCLM